MPRNLCVLFCLLLAGQSLRAEESALFTDDFERGLAGWEVYGVNGVSIRTSGDPTHGQVMVLDPNGDVHALIRGSEAWNGVRFEGEFLFPTNGDSYLGFVYNFARRGARMDFGNVYVKGNGSYLQVNPHRDYNVGRTLYPELSAKLTGEAAVRMGAWLPFRVEVIGSECHVYVGPVGTPQIVFGALEMSGGALGLQPRSVGDPVWVDNVRVSALGSFTYSGPPVPSFAYDPGALLTGWEVLGPLEATDDDAARGVGTHPWRAFETDRRGAVVTGRIVDTQGPRSVAYFRTRIISDRTRTATLHFSTIDDLAIWINGRFQWFLDRAARAWPDFSSNPEHEGQRIPVDLVEGQSTIVVRIRGGVYATGGFFVRLEDATPSGP